MVDKFQEIIFDHTELYRKFTDDPEFKKWLCDTLFNMDYARGISMEETQTMSPSQIRKAGIVALARSLGPTGMARFTQQFDMGTGDYTKERSNWLAQMDLDEIIKGINKMRKLEPSAVKDKK